MGILKMVLIKSCFLWGSGGENAQSRVALSVE